FFKASNRVSWQEGNIYLLRQVADQAKGVLVLKEYEDTFDGERVYGGRLSPGKPVLFKRELARVVKDEPVGHYLDPGYLRAAGWFVPRTMAEWTKPRAVPELLEHLQ